MLYILSISICHIFPEANGVAHRLAHLSSSYFENFSWVEEAPVIIWDVLFEDCCNYLISGPRNFIHPERISPFIYNT